MSILYHTGFEEIRQPDIHHGRKNADFGQGFYLSADRAFSERWARERKGRSTIVNAYEFSFDGLRVKRFSRDQAWFDYIFRNRAGYEDSLRAFDVIVGPIANDTLYDTFGLLTSGVLPPEQAVRLLTIGPVYGQTVIKSERAAAQLSWQSGRVLDSGEIARLRETVRQEEAAFQRLFNERLAEML
ncbi:MAG: DUF3990 domain-containing protein [Clostridia bacterium]|nr:DUF3990 domain-containing protein [Clostridia bacterium]